MDHRRQKPVVTEELQACFHALVAGKKNIRLVGLCTEDGFDIKSLADKSFELDSDKLAAMASSISALSNSSAQQLKRDGFTITIIETEDGNILLMKTRYLDQPCVISMATARESSLAQGRFELKRFAAKVAAISL